MTESKLQAKCVAKCKEHDVLCFKTVAVGRRGYPDLSLFFRDGTHVLVELKTPTGELSRLQVKTITRIIRYGGKVHVIDSLEKFEALLRYYGRGEGKKPDVWL